MFDYGSEASSAKTLFPFYIASTDSFSLPFTLQFVFLHLDDVYNDLLVAELVDILILCRTMLKHSRCFSVEFNVWWQC